MASVLLPSPWPVVVDEVEEEDGDDDDDDDDDDDAVEDDAVLKEVVLFELGEVGYLLLAPSPPKCS
jgi:hypothetical protein